MTILKQRLTEAAGIIKLGYVESKKGGIRVYEKMF